MIISKYKTIILSIDEEEKLLLLLGNVRNNLIPFHILILVNDFISSSIRNKLE